MLPLRKKRLGELLIEAGLITEKELKKALDDQRFSNLKLGKILVWRLRCISKENLVRLLGKQHGVAGIDVFRQTVDKKAPKLIPKRLAEKHKILPIGLIRDGGIIKLAVATFNPSDIATLDELAFVSSYPVFPVFAEEEDLVVAIISLSQETVFGVDATRIATSK